MEFIDKGNIKEIIFEESDTNYEKQIVEQGLAFIRSLLNRMRETEGK